MTENEIARIAVDLAFHIHVKMGPGLLETVYRRIMAFELRKRSLAVREEVPLPVIWEDQRMEIGFRADLLINRKLIVEIKSLESVAPVHKKVLLTYLRTADCKLGLLINFGEGLIKDGISRVVNGL